MTGKSAIGACLTERLDIEGANGRPHGHTLKGSDKRHCILVRRGGVRAFIGVELLRNGGGWQARPYARGAAELKQALSHPDWIGLAEALGHGHKVQEANGRRLKF